MEIVDGRDKSSLIIKGTVTAAKVLLVILAGGALVTVGAAMPGVLALAGKMNKKIPRKKMVNAFYGLKRRKIIEIVEEDGDKFRVRLTNKGRQRIKDLYLDGLTIKKPARWDGKWRVFIFDIPAKPKSNHNAREALRHKIKELGFFQMQKSVWVYPYECEDELLFVAEAFGVTRHIEVLTVEKLLHGNTIRRKFNL